MKWQRLMWLCNWRRWEAARAFCQWLMWKSYRSRARERCLLQPSLQPLQLPIPSSRSELILKLKTNQFLTRMGPYHNRPIYHSMKSPSQPWAQQVPTPPSPGLDSNLPQSHSLPNPGLAPPCPMEPESRNQPPSAPFTTTNHKMTTRWSCTRETLCTWWRGATMGGSLAPAREQESLELSPGTMWHTWGLLREASTHK